MAQMTKAMPGLKPIPMTEEGSAKGKHGPQRSSATEGVRLWPVVGDNSDDPAPIQGPRGIPD